MFQPNFVTFTNTDVVSTAPMEGFGGNQNGGFTYASFADGSGGLIKQMKDWHGNKTGRLYRAEILAAQEYLAALVGKTMNAPIRDCRFYGADAKTVVMPFIHGESGKKLGETELPINHQGIALRLFDYLTANADRRPKNWMRTPDGRIVGIDHALCNFRPRNPSPELIAEFWNNGVSHESLLILKPKLQNLAIDFHQLGMGDKHETMMANLSQLINAFQILTQYAVITKGDVPGHPFHGNQYEDGAGGGEIQPFCANGSSSDAVGWLDGHVGTKVWGESDKAFTGNLTPEELSALREYTGDTFRDINAELREHDQGITEADDSGMLYSGPLATNIQSAIDKSVIDAPVVAFRGLRDDVFAELQPGDEFRDPGFSSTSMVKSVANAFAGDEGTVARIEIPAGSHAVAFTSIGEGELLLGANSHYTFNGYDDKGTALLSYVGTDPDWSGEIKKAAPSGSKPTSRFVWNAGDIRITRRNGEIQKGDVPGHDFHGNQYTEGVLQYDPNKLVSAWSTAERTADWRKLDQPWSQQLNELVLKSPPSTTELFSGVSVPQNEVEGRFGVGKTLHFTLASFSAKASVARDFATKREGYKVYSTPKSNTRVIIHIPEGTRSLDTSQYGGGVGRFHEHLVSGDFVVADQRVANGYTHIYLQSAVQKGDLPGHDFHGNQWTDGYAGGKYAVCNETSESAIKSWVEDRVTFTCYGPDNWQHDNERMTEAQHSAVSHYAGDGYEAINYGLRWTDNIRTDRTAVVIQKAIDASVINENIRVFRGFDGNVFAEQHLQPGDTFRDPAFSSTSVSQAVGERTNGGILAKIDVPAGSHAVGITFMDEAEVLLGANASFTFHGYDSDGAAHLTYLGTDPMHTGVIQKSASAPKPRTSRFIWNAGDFIVTIPNGEIQKGDVLGHPFHGNQWVEFGSMADAGKFFEGKGVSVDTEAAEKMGFGVGEMTTIAKSLESANEKWPNLYGGEIKQITFERMPTGVAGVQRMQDEFHNPYSKLILDPSFISVNRNGIPELATTNCARNASDVLAHEAAHAEINANRFIGSQPVQSGMYYAYGENGQPVPTDSRSGIITSAMSSVGYMSGFDLKTDLISKEISDYAAYSPDEFNSEVAVLFANPDRFSALPQETQDKLLAYQSFVNERYGSQVVKSLGGADTIVCNFGLSPEQIQNLRQQAITKGDSPGHEFHGNQWVSGYSSSEQPRKWSKSVVKSLGKGERPIISPKELGILLRQVPKLDPAKTATADITELRVNGTNLMGQNGLGFTREEMPQIPTKLRDEFTAALAEQGITSTKEFVDPTTLQPSQSEIGLGRVSNCSSRPMVKSHKASSCSLAKTTTSLTAITIGRQT